MGSHFWAKLIHREGSMARWGVPSSICTLQSPGPLVWAWHGALVAPRGFMSINLAHEVCWVDLMAHFQYISRQNWSTWEGSWPIGVPFLGRIELKIGCGGEARGPLQFHFQAKLSLQWGKTCPFHMQVGVGVFAMPLLALGCPSTQAVLSVFNQYF